MNIYLEVRAAPRLTLRENSAELLLPRKTNLICILLNYLRI